MLTPNDNNYNKCTGHWCAYPSPTQSYTNQQTQRNSKTQSASIVQSSAKCCENSGRDWQNIKNGFQKRAPKVILSSFSKTQAFYRHRSTDGHQ